MTFARLLRRTVVQALVFVGVSILAGYYTLDRVVPSVAAPVSAMSEIQPASISLEELRKMVESNEAVLIDARSSAAYEVGHAHQAISLPWVDFDAALAQNLDLFLQDKRFVVYCDGEGCDLSHLLARRLSELGFNQVLVFEEGWNAWKTAGLPTAP